MNAWEHFERLAALAGDEAGPHVDVTARVLRDIRQRSALRIVDLPLWVFSGLSLAAASVMAMLALQSWTAATDPLSGLFETLTMVMQ